MRTPIELLIFQLQYSYNLNPNPFTASAIQAATALLPHEKQAIENAYLSGKLSGALQEPYTTESAGNYYTETFQKP
jgi:hypothetical protein